MKYVTYFQSQRLYRCMHMLDSRFTSSARVRYSSMLHISSSFAALCLGLTILLSVPNCPGDIQGRLATYLRFTFTLHWRHNERNGVSNHRRLDCLLSLLFRRRSKKTSKPRVTALCEGNPPVTAGFPSQRSITAEMLPFDNVSMTITIYCVLIRSIVIISFVITSLAPRQYPHHPVASGATFKIIHW